MAEEKNPKDAKVSKDPKKLSKPVKSIIDAVEKLTVLELAELVEALEDKFGVSAAPMAAAVAPAANSAPAGEPAEEKTEFDVNLASFGDKKIQVIKAVRVVKPDLGLADAKKLVESAPATILEGAKKEDAEDAKKKLEEAGGTVELK
jgi:large subunit ribosomal protein L7/L12